MEASLEDSDLSDHKLIRLQIRFMKTENDIDLDHMPYKITQSDIRKAATSDKAILKIKNNQNPLE